ncbi:MAG TPA: radical SAM protein, partial [Bacteroidota bacterium]
VTAFHPDYKMTDPDPTPGGTLLRAVEIGRGAGLQFVYAGNLPLGKAENTYCPTCGELLIERRGFTVRRDRMQAGACPRCKSAIPGVWR